MGLAGSLDLTGAASPATLCFLFVCFLALFSGTTRKDSVAPSSVLIDGNGLTMKKKGLDFRLRSFSLSAFYEKERHNRFGAVSQNRCVTKWAEAKRTGFFSSAVHPFCIESFDYIRPERRCFRGVSGWVGVLLPLI